MSYFKKEGGFMDVIRCDEPDYLIWKWRPEGTVGKTKRENAIRWGSNLSVKSGSLAVFVYKGQHNYIVGPYSGKISTANLPIIARIVGLAYDGGSPFPAEVYFINLARVIQVQFAVPYFNVYDPNYTEFSVPIAVRGTISFRIGDIESFIALHRLDEFDLDTFNSQIRNAVSKYVKGVVTNHPEFTGTFVVQIEKHIQEINNVVDAEIKVRLAKDFGVIVTETDIGDIEVDKTSDDYHRLMQITKDVATATAVATAEANIKNIYDMQKINAENYKDTLKRNREEDQYARHLNTQSQNINVHSINQQAAVGIAGAEGLGNMGNNSIGGGGDGGLNPAGLMAGMAIGGAFGQNIAGMVNNTMAQGNTQTPPPVPSSAYYVAKNGQPTGPFELSILKQMYNSGSLTRDSLVWKNGMAEWIKAEDVSDLITIFSEIPDIPND